MATGIGCAATITTCLVAAYKLGQRRKTKRIEAYSDIQHNRLERFRRTTPPGGLLLRLKPSEEGTRITDAYKSEGVVVHRVNDGPGDYKPCTNVIACPCSLEELENATHL